MVNDRTDRDLLIEVHGMVERIDERTGGLPKRVGDLEVASARHEASLTLIKRAGAAVVAVFGVVIAALRYIANNA